jgi:hypothetical protein
MPTVQEGPRGTIDLSNSLIVQEMMAQVALLDPSDKPIVTVMNEFDKVQPTENPEPQHAEDESFPNIDLADGSHTPADITIAVNNPLFYLNGDILHVPRTGENMRVSSAAGTSPITVVRGLGAPPADLLDGEPIWILGGSSEEGATSRDSKNTLEVPYTHYCQIVRNSVYHTGTAMATRVHGSDFEDQWEKKLIEHKKQLEYFILWGTPSRTAVNNQWLRTMEGINHRIQTNRFAVNGVLGEGEFNAFCMMGFQHGNSRKLLVASPNVVQAITNFAQRRLEVDQGAKEYGLAINSITTPHGVVDIVSHRELKGATYGGYALLLDPDYLVMRYLRAGSGDSDKYKGDRYCKRIRNIQANDEDSRKDEVFSELTFMLMQERTMAVMTDVEG